MATEEKLKAPKSQFLLSACVIRARSAGTKHKSHHRQSNSLPAPLTQATQVLQPLGVELGVLFSSNPICVPKLRITNCN